MVALTSVKSSNIAKIGYDDARSELHVQFHTGAVHAYSTVPRAKFDELMAAESIGSHFHHHIRNKHAQRKVS